MKIVRKKLNDLKLSEYNPRVHNKDFLKNLAYSMKEFGYQEPIIYNKQTNHIVGGHARYKVLQNQKVDEVDVVEVDLDLDKEKAFNLALNKISGDWDYYELKKVLNDLYMGELKELDLTGFNEYEINNIINGIDDPYDEWKDMPDYQNEDLTSVNKVIVHFASNEDRHKFAEVLGIKLTDKTRSVWYPEQVKDKPSDYVYVEKKNEN